MHKKKKKAMPSERERENSPISLTNHSKTKANSIINSEKNAR